MDYSKLFTKNFERRWSVSIVDSLVGLDSQECKEILASLEAEHKLRMKTLKAFIAAKVAEEEAEADTSDFAEDEEKGDGADDPNGPYTPIS